MTNSNLSQSAHAIVRLLDRDQVAGLLQQDDVLDAVRDAFVLHSRREGRLFPLIRQPLSTGGIFGIKAGDVASRDLLGFKAAGFWPGNRQGEREPHQATVLLFDPATGRPLCMMDGNDITTMRTGAAGGLGLQQLARPDSRSLCLFGTGVQGRVQLRFALSLMPTLERVRYVTSHGQRDSDFEALFAGRCDIALALDGSAAVADSDVVITATTGKGPLFELAAVQAGTHLTCVGSDTKGKRELPEGLLPRVRLYVDDRAQASQIGELQWAPETPCTELGDVLSGAVAFERQRDDITVFDMTGIALQDLTVAHKLLARATADNLGTALAWPW